MNELNNKRSKKAAVFAVIEADGFVAQTWLRSQKGEDNPWHFFPGHWFQGNPPSSITKTFKVSSSDQQIPCFIARCTTSLSSLLHIIYSPCREKERRGIGSASQSGQVHHQHTATTAQIPALFNPSPLERNLEVFCSASAQKSPHLSPPYTSQYPTNNHTCRNSKAPKAEGC